MQRTAFVYISLHPLESAYYNYVLFSIAASVTIKMHYSIYSASLKAFIETAKFPLKHVPPNVFCNEALQN